MEKQKYFAPELRVVKVESEDSILIPSAGSFPYSPGAIYQEPDV